VSTNCLNPALSFSESKTDWSYASEAFSLATLMSSTASEIFSNLRPLGSARGQHDQHERTVVRIGGAAWTCHHGEQSREVEGQRRRRPLWVCIQ
jgi:hypothetical protein